MNFRKLYPWLLSLLALPALPALGANVSITGLPAATALTSDDLLEIVDDPSGIKVSKSVTAAKVFSAALASDPEIACIAALSSAADKLIYFTGSGTCALTTVSSFVRTVLGAADAATARGTLGLTIGTDVQAWDADLDNWAGKTAPSGTVVGTTDSQTLTNKILTSPAISTPTGIVKGDVGLGNVDNTSDATKNAAVATLTNKTLTSPAISTPTGIVKGDVGLGNVDNTSDATKNAAVATLTNKSIDGSQITSAVATASALAANGTNCSAGSYALGVDTAGNAEGCTVAATGTGDASTNTSSSVDGEGALFSGTGGKTIKRATGTGVARLASGVQTASELSGDCTTSGSNAITCTKTSGSNFAASATTDTTSASNISSGTLPAGRLPALTGDVTSSVGSAATTVVETHPNVTAINNASSPYAVLSTDSMVTCDATAGAVVINLPAATGTHREISFKKIDSSANACTPTRAGADLIDGATSYSLTAQYAASKVQDSASATWIRTHVNQMGGDITGLSAVATVAKVNGNTPGGTCTNQAVTSLSSSAVPTCTTLTSTYVDSSVATVGAANTFTANQNISDAEPRRLFNETDQGADLKLWDLDLNGGVLTGRTRTDADGAGKNWLSVTRGTTTTISNVSLGNASDNPIFNWLGTGQFNVAGTVSANQFTATSNVNGARFNPSSATATGNGLYLPGTNEPGIASNGVKRASWDANGQYILATVGAGISIKEGSNAKMGTCTLSVGTCTVSTTAVTASSRVFLTAQTLGTVTVGQGLAVSARTAGTSFTVTSGSLSDTSVVAWMIVEPSP